MVEQNSGTNRYRDNFIKKIPIVDAHHHFMVELAVRRDRGEKNVFDRFFYPTLKKGGVDILQAPVGGTGSCVNNLTDRASFGALQQIDMLRKEEANSEKLIICETVEDIRKAKNENKIGIIMDLEGSRPLDGLPNDPKDLSMLRTFYRLGLRGTCIVTTGRSKMGDGPGEARADAGLTTFGKLAIEEMNNLGMIIDVSHSSAKLFKDMIEITEYPVLDSHVGADKVVSQQKNLPDWRIRTMAENGGVIGVPFAKSFICGDEYHMKDKECTVKSLVKHIDYIVDLVGVNHVAVGSDIDEFNLVENMPRCWSPAPGQIEGFEFGVPKGSRIMDDLDRLDKLPLLIEALDQKGYKDHDIEKIMGGNMFRLYDEVLS